MLFTILLCKLFVCDFITELNCADSGFWVAFDRNTLNFKVVQLNCVDKEQAA